LRELDLLRRRQQRMPAGLAQEELERVRRGLVREWGEARRRALRLGLDDLVEVGVPDQPRDLAGLEQLLQLLAQREGLELDRHHVPPLVTRHSRPSKREEGSAYRP